MGSQKLNEKIPIEEKRGPNSNLRFAEGESFIIKVTNKGSKAAYYNILDIWADNQDLRPNSQCRMFTPSWRLFY